MAPANAEPTNADIMAALGQLVTVVGALVQSGTQHAAPETSAPADVTHIHVTQELGFAPLVELDDANVTRRTTLAHDMGILATESGQELILHGARGFYRRLDRQDHEQPSIRRDHVLRLIQDAEQEDVLEAQAMGRDLLQVWEATDEADFIAPPAA